jgi:hypothetical protein
MKTTFRHHPPRSLRASGEPDGRSVSITQAAVERFMIVIFLTVPATGWSNDSCTQTEGNPETIEGDVNNEPATASYRNVPDSRYLAVTIPAVGRVESTSGRVQFYSRGEGWIKLPPGYMVGDRHKILIGAGAELILRFSECELVALEPAVMDRFIELQLSQPE